MLLSTQVRVFEEILQNFSRNASKRKTNKQQRLLFRYYADTMRRCIFNVKILKQSRNRTCEKRKDETKFGIKI